MAENKTVPTGFSVDEYINAIEHPQRKEDCTTLLQIMQRITGKTPKMWGATMVGFGTYHYKYESGREGTMFCTGFSNRKQALTVYLMCELEKNEDLLEQLGAHKIGKSCLYIKRLSDINLSVLEQLIEESLQALSRKYTVLD